MREEIKRFIEKVSMYNAEVLEIKKPKISYVRKKLMGTPTTKAEASSDGDEIKINEDSEWEGDGWKERTFCIVSHEVRHCWQMLTGYNSKAIEEYKPSSMIDLEEYNEQELEVDAWAWAWFMLKVNYGVDLVLSEGVIGPKASKDIFEREREIEQKYLVK